MPAPPLTTASLTRRTIRGVAWTLTTSLGSRAVGLVGTLLLARFLSPTEYGEVTAAAIVALTASSVTTFGVGIYLVANAAASRAEVFHATCFFLGTGLAALAGLLALSGPLGTFFDANLQRFMVPLAASVVLDRISYIPERMLVRKLRFRWLSVSRAGGELAFTAVALGGAMLGAGGIAIAWGGLARSALRVVTIVPAVDWREWLEPHRLRMSTMTRIVRFGMDVSVGSIAGFLMRRWDNLLVSRYYGPGVMGAYNYAYNLADTPAVAVGEQVIDVLGASFPHAGKARRAAALLRSWTMLAILMLPLAAGLGAVAGTVVQTFFDARWQGIARMLALLSVLAAVRPMTELLRAYLYACELPRVVAWLEWMGLGALVLALATVGRLGIEWACASVGAVFVLRTGMALWAVRRLDGVPPGAFLRPLLGPLAACAVMSVVVLLVGRSLPGLPAGVRLLVQVACGSVVYAAGAVLLFRPASSEFLRIVRSALKGR
jgi:PST family polysaccharide transporter